MPADEGPRTYFIHECCKKGPCFIYPYFSCSRAYRGLEESFGQMRRGAGQRVENEKDFSLFRSLLQGSLMPCYKWGWHLAQSANLLCSVILIKGFWDCLKVDHDIVLFWGGGHVVWKIGFWCLFSDTRRFSFDLTKHFFAFYFQKTSFSDLYRQLHSSCLAWFCSECAFMPKQVWMWGGRACSELLKSTH